MSESQNAPPIRPKALNELFRPPDETSSSEQESNASKYNFRMWWNSIQSIEKEDYERRSNLYDRALHYLPGSYKLWFNYLKESRKNAKIKFAINSDIYEVVNKLHEKSLVFMAKMPRIWMDYIRFLIKQCKITETRKTFDRCLFSLPISQHETIWREYLKWASKLDVLKTTNAIYKRYVQYNPDGIEEYYDYLIQIEDHQGAGEALITMLNDENFHSKVGKSTYDLWMDLCRLLSQHPDTIKKLSTEAIIRHCLKLYTDEIGNLWVYLAEYYIRLGLFEKARDIFEEALSAITTARDFGVIFNAYSKFEEQLVSVPDDDNGDEEAIDNQINSLIDSVYNEIEDESISLKQSKLQTTVDEKLLRLENLLHRRPFLLSSVLLRQNPHNVYEWLNYIKCCEFDEYLIVQAFSDAVSTVNPQKAFGKPHKLWVEFAKYYEKSGDLDSANKIFNRATNCEYKSADELANVWCEWAEMHIRNGNVDSARKILKYACSKKIIKNTQGNSVSHPIYSLKVWSLYADLEENCGKEEDIKAIYQSMIEYKIASPLTILNFAAYLEKMERYEEEFKVFERGVHMFTWPHVYDIWITYISKFVETYGGANLERLRYMLEQVLDTSPKASKYWPQYKLFYYIYADIEENFGLISRQLRIFDRAMTSCPKEELLELIKVSIAKTSKFFGITKTRKLFERALELLDMPIALEIGMKYAKMERKLGEIDRARALYMYLSQMCNPSSTEMKERFWKVWEQFEIVHGSEDTYKNFLKIERSISYKFSVVPTIEDKKSIVDSKK